MAGSLGALLAFSIVLAVLLEDGAGLPVSGRVRTKRCSCSNGLDEECYYFCHLDIIWVNTPGKTTPYGLGSPLSRRRRSAGRCACSSPDDRTCLGFCHRSSENPALVVVSPREQHQESSVRSGQEMLQTLRWVSRSNQRAAEKLGARSR